MQVCMCVISYLQTWLWYYDYNSSFTHLQDVLLYLNKSFGSGGRFTCAQSICEAHTNYFHINKESCLSCWPSQEWVVSKDMSLGHES